jgi:transcriptional regulator with XRE-family HTH domain
MQENKKVSAVDQEAKRLRLFMEREGITQDEMAELLDTNQSTVSKYLSGKLKIPLKVVKVLHLKKHLNYEWFFHGTGTVKKGVLEKRNIQTDLVDIHAGLGLMMASQDQMRDLLNKLVRDFYADKHKV